MLKRTVLGILLFSAMFIISPAVISEEEPFVMDDFEVGLANWYGSGGGGAVNGMIEHVKDAHDGKRAMQVTLPKGNAGWTLAQRVGRGFEFAQLEDSGHEAINFWIKGIEGIDVKPPALQLMLLGIGDHGTDNRWTYNFTAPLDEWAFFSVPFKEFKPWNQEKREFKIEFLDYPGFYMARSPWPQMEFIVDQMEVGYITQIKPKPVEPLGKLPVTWGRTKRY